MPKQRFGFGRSLRSRRLREKGVRALGVNTEDRTAVKFGRSKHDPMSQTAFGSKFDRPVGKMRTRSKY